MASGNIADFLKRFETIEPPAKEVKDVTVAILEEVVGVDVPEDKINLSRGIVWLSVDSLIKSEVLVKKEKILQIFQEKMGRHAPTDIR